MLDPGKICFDCARPCSTQVRYVSTVLCSVQGIYVLTVSVKFRVFRNSQTKFGWFRLSRKKLSFSYSLEIEFTTVGFSSWYQSIKKSVKIRISKFHKSQRGFKIKLLWFSSSSNNPLFRSWEILPRS